jgi:hypothetical protein
MKNKLSILLLFLIGMSSLTVNAQKAITLRLQPKQGQTLTANSKATMTTLMNVQGQSMSMGQNMEFRQSFTTKAVSDKQVAIETQIEAIKMSMSQMGMKLEYDSEHPEKTSPMLAGQTKELEKTLKKSTTLTYDAMGKLISDSNDLEMNQLANIILEFPEQEVTEGSKWNTKKTQSVNEVDIVVDMEYTVTSISKKKVELSFTGNVDSKEVKGTYNGTASINPQTGMITSSTTKSTVSMTVSEQGISMPITVTSTSTVEVK